MTALTRWDPLREMAALRSAMDRFFDEPFSELPRIWERGGEYSLALDVAEDADKYVVKASVPGIDPNDVEITLSDNTLTIRGETKEDKEVEEKNYHLRERRFGRFMRSVSLPMSVNAEQVEAIHENGVLTLHLPKAEAVKPKRIEVKKTVASN